MSDTYIQLLASAATSNGTETAQDPYKGNIAGSKANNHGSGFTLVEDLLLCKAFIAASEDPTKGVSQKGSTFKKTMHEYYVTLLNEQEKLDKMAYQGSSSITCTFLEETQPAVVYARRTPDSCFTRFKATVSHRVQKFLAIESTMKYESGWNDEDFYNSCKAAYVNRYPKFGNPDDIKQCITYLRDKPKYTLFIKSLEKSNQGSAKKPSVRPTGSKDAKQKESDKKLVEAMIGKQKNMDGSDNNPDNKKKDAFFDKLGTAVECISSIFADKIRKEEEEVFVASLETPDRVEWKRESAKLRLVELKAKRRKLELEQQAEEENTKNAPTTSVGISNGASIDHSDLTDD